MYIGIRMHCSAAHAETFSARQLSAVYVRAIHQPTSSMVTETGQGRKHTAERIDPCRPMARKVRRVDAEDERGERAPRAG